MTAFKKVQLKKSIKVCQQCRSITCHQWKYLLFNNRMECMENVTRFVDVTMGFCDEAEVCELIRSVLINSPINTRTTI